MTNRNSWNAQRSGRCLSTIFSVHNCQRFVVQNVRVTRNLAQFGGGIFVTHPRSIDLVCLSNNSSIRRSLHEAMSTRLSQNGEFEFDAIEDLSCGYISDNEIIVRVVTFVVYRQCVSGKGH